MGATVPAQNGGIESKVGLITAFTVTIKVVESAQVPSAGLKVYTVVPANSVEIDGGFQVPVIPLREVPGRIGAIEFWQIGAMESNTAVIDTLTVTSRVAWGAHTLLSGVNV